MAASVAMTREIRRIPSRRWYEVSLIAIGVLAAVAIVRPYRTSRKGTEMSVAALAAAAREDARSVEPRLSGGFPWAPFRPPAKKADDAGSTPAPTRGAATASEQHVGGVAELLGGGDRRAVEMLSAATVSTSDAGTWSDLAAAYYVTSIRYAAPELLADALAAADKALASDDRFTEALFNRALVIERLGLRDDAREAWKRFLAADSTSGWAVEAREHLRNLEPVVPLEDLFKRQYDKLAGSDEAARALARDRREEARLAAETDILGRWGAATIGGEAAAASRHLRFARDIGGEIARLNGDRMVQRAVAAIDQADEAGRATLAAAHADYKRARQLYDDNQPIEAEPLFRRAAAGFERGRSPMLFVARLWAANAAYEQGRHDEALRDVERWRAEIPPDLLACRAQLTRQRGVCHASRAEWGEAIRLLGESIAMYERIGEVENAASATRVLAVVYDRIGHRSTAWSHRMVALRGIGGRSDLRLEKAVSSIVQESMLRQGWPVAAAFLNLEVDIATRMGDDVGLVEALHYRAAVRERLKDVAGARADIQSASGVIAKVKDPGYRAYLQNDALIVRAMVTPSPEEAVALLTTAMAFQEQKADRMYRPRLFLQRSRALREHGDAAGAAADLERGIAELEAHRASLPAGEARWGAFHGAEELFEDAVALALDQGDVDRAFAFAERARARSLLDSYGRSPSLDRAQLPEKTVVVEYVALPSRLIIFTADRSGVAAVAVPRGRDALAAEVEGLRKALESNHVATAKRSAAALHRTLVEPVSSRLVGATTLVFVPDATTATVAYGALVHGRGAYLLESHTIVVAPSAAVFAAAAERRRDAPAPRSALVIANSAPGAGEEALAFVRSEAEQVALRYPSAIRLYEDAARHDELARRAPDADVIHFGGHATGDESGLEPSSISMRDDGGRRRIGVAEIARLRLRKTAVVVLAGCSTARGERRAAEGVISIAHGFLTAGAPSVVATLWPIDDREAAIFFPRLHARLAEGMPAAEALRAAQIESMQRRDVSMSTWAAVQVIGS